MKVKTLITCLIIVQIAFSEVPNEVYQLSYYHGKHERDSVVARKPSEPDLPYYGEIEIFRKGKSLFKYSEKYMELEAHPGVLFKEHGDWDDICYIFRYNDRPNPDKFLVVRIKNSKAFKLGITDNSTAEIFGDIDYDGKFEIGGLSYLFQASKEGEKPDSTFYSNSYKVFGIDSGFPVDKKLTKYFLNLLLSKDWLNLKTIQPTGATETG